MSVVQGSDIARGQVGSRSNSKHLCSNPSCFLVLVWGWGTCSWWSAELILPLGGSFWKKALSVQTPIVATCPSVCPHHAITPSPNLQCCWTSWRACQLFSPSKYKQSCIYRAQGFFGVLFDTTEYVTIQRKPPFKYCRFPKAIYNAFAIEAFVSAKGLQLLKIKIKHF